jgi:hypothetical protein
MTNYLKNLNASDRAGLVFAFGTITGAVLYLYLTAI